MKIYIGRVYIQKASLCVPVHKCDYLPVRVMLLCKLLAVIFIPLRGLQWEASLFYNIIINYCCDDDVSREDPISS